MKLEIEFSNPFKKAVNVEKPKGGPDMFKRIVRQSVERSPAEIAKWKDALVLAEDHEKPNRLELFRVIQELDRDPHLNSLINTRRNAVTATDFFIKRNGEVDDELTKIFRDEWFYKFIEMAIDSKFWGFSLIQLEAVFEGVYSGVSLIPRQYVVPEKDSVRKNLTDDEFINFSKGAYMDWVVAVGDKYDLGLINKAVPLLIYKKDVFAAWSEYADVFGAPIRLGKTDLMNDTKRANMDEMLLNMGGFAYATLDKDDDVTLVESNNRDAFQVFKQMIETVNAELSKLFLGQTGTTDEKAFSGSAEVHERILNAYSSADRRFIKNTVSRRLLPIMIRKNLIPGDATFHFDTDEKLSIMQKREIVASLSNNFSFDLDELSKSFGFTFTAEKSAGGFGSEGAPLDAVKKAGNMYSEALKTIK